MFNKFQTFIFSAILVIAAGVALATVGTAPIPSSGPGLVDGAWLNGVVGGQNFTSKYGISTAGTTQATATQLLPNYYLAEVDTSDSGGAQGVALPSCIQGKEIVINNNTAYTFFVYPSILNNPITAAQDKINNLTSATIATYSAKTFGCPKTGVWFAK